MIMDAWRGGARSVLAISPTGSGKTTLFGELTRALDAGGKRVLILAHRRELIDQACNRLREFGVTYGVIMAGVEPTPYRRVQVASIQTLVRRSKLPDAELVIIDEAHLSTAETYRRILDGYPRARILGPTATPWRLSGKPLAGAYDASVIVATPRELREQGHLCDYVGFSYKHPDLSEVKTTGGDYNERESAAAMSSGVIVDNIVEQWQAHASGLSTIVFAVTVEHSKTLTERFRAAGAVAEHLDGETPLEQRRAILRRVAQGQTQVLCNVGVAVEGLDIPRLKCCVLARPTKSLARAIQMMGRVRRPWEGQVARIHDHAFVIKQHGLPDADRDYSLSTKPEAPPSLSQCKRCLAVREPGQPCILCGAEAESVLIGERVVQTIKDAEQYEFSSATEEAPEVRPSKPVEITWGQVAVDRVFEGRLMKRWTEQREHGPQRKYLINGAKRDYELPGTSRLDALMDHIQIPDSVRITYKGRRGTSSLAPHEFKVEVDDGSPDAETLEMARRYQAGETFAAIAKSFKVHPTAVMRKLKRAGVEARSMSQTITLARGHEPEKRRLALELYLGGKTLKEVSATVGASLSTVHEWVSAERVSHG